MTTEEKLEKTSERVYARLTNSMLKQMADKYEELLKEKTSWEMDKKNEETEKDYPEYGAVCINLDGCELSFPFNNGAKIEVVDGDDVYVTEVADTIDIKKIIGEILNAKNDIVGIRTFTTKEIEFYNKDKLYNDNEKVTYTKVYEKTFEGYYPKKKVSAIYKVVGKLK